MKRITSVVLCIVLTTTFVFAAHLIGSPSDQTVTVTTNGTDTATSSPLSGQYDNVYILYTYSQSVRDVIGASSTIDISTDGGSSFPTNCSTCNRTPGSGTNVCSGTDERCPSAPTDFDAQDLSQIQIRCIGATDADCSITAWEIWGDGRRLFTVVIE